MPRIPVPPKIRRRARRPDGTHIVKGCGEQVAKSLRLDSYETRLLRVPHLQGTRLQNNRFAGRGLVHLDLEAPDRLYNTLGPLRSQQAVTRSETASVGRAKRVRSEDLTPP